ncbi:MAG: hypothetical protein II245_08645 [Bacteroidaceae bacterium]|nr:hypothetical protein [Bacteroidaceae bacterium]MBQ5621738.1 hypothetical protein [Bacteroidaceae bacterium]MBR0543734.1 hypothetical protein [Bacteroidaceae bacterium]
MPFSARGFLFYAVTSTDCSRQNTITHKDIAIAFEQSLTHYRIVRLLGRLVEEGRLVREGKGAQTRYRLPK